jgi:hypothetical protein
MAFVKLIVTFAILRILRLYTVTSQRLISVQSVVEFSQNNCRIIAGTPTVFKYLIMT